MVGPWTRHAWKIHRDEGELPRSTRPITEFALNVLYRLQPPESNADHKELVTRGLIENQQTEMTSGGE